MARRRPLRTHLLAEHAGNRLVTACGMTAVPNDFGTSFPKSCQHTTRWEGRVPNSLGVGIVVASSLGFHHMAAPGGLCGSCEQRYAKGEGV